MSDKIIINGHEINTIQHRDITRINGIHRPFAWIVETAGDLNSISVTEADTYRVALVLDDYVPYTLVDVNPSVWLDAGDVKGPRGIRGLPGKRGPRGFPGEVGDEGLQGPQGHIGPRGKTGPKGDTGVVGPVGEQGVQGPRPEDASPGEMGPPGPRGHKGRNFHKAGSVVKTEPIEHHIDENGVITYPGIYKNQLYLCNNVTSRGIASRTQINNSRGASWNGETTNNGELINTIDVMTTGSRYSNLDVPGQARFIGINSRSSNINNLYMNDEEFTFEVRGNNVQVDSFSIGPLLAEAVPTIRDFGPPTYCEQYYKFYALNQIATVMLIEGMDPDLKYMSAAYIDKFQFRLHGHLVDLTPFVLNYQKSVEGVSDLMNSQGTAIETQEDLYEVLDAALDEWKDGPGVAVMEAIDADLPRPSNWDNLRFELSDEKFDDNVLDDPLMNNYIYLYAPAGEGLGDLLQLTTNDISLKIIPGVLTSDDDYNWYILDYPMQLSAISGGSGITIDYIDLSRVPAGASADLIFNAYSAPDRWKVYYPPDTLVYDTGWRGADHYSDNPPYNDWWGGTGQGNVEGVFTKQSGNNLARVVTNGYAPGTAWIYRVEVLEQNVPDDPDIGEGTNQVVTYSEDNTLIGVGRGVEPGTECRNTTLSELQNN